MLVRLLIKAGQGHLFHHWPHPGRLGRGPVLLALWRAVSLPIGDGFCMSRLNDWPHWVGQQWIG